MPVDVCGHLKANKITLNSFRVCSNIVECGSGVDQKQEAASSKSCHIDGGKRKKEKKIASSSHYKSLSPVHKPVA